VVIITLKNRSVDFLDVEKTITNVTIKDAPYEVSDTNDEVWRSYTRISA
jgi:hypothetical protein